MTFPPLLVVSHLWWSEAHPDPDAKQLCHLARALEWYSAERSARHGEARDAAVFVGYSCVRAGRHGGSPRSATAQEAAASYTRALGSLDVLYAHVHTVKLLLTTVPGAPTECLGAFAARGWTAYEAASAALISPAKHVLDLGKLDAALDAALDARRGAIRAPAPRAAAAAPRSAVAAAAATAPQPYVHDLAAGVLGRLHAARRPPRSPAAFRRWLEQVRLAGES